MRCVYIGLSKHHKFSGSYRRKKTNIFYYNNLLLSLFRTRIVSYEIVNDNFKCDCNYLQGNDIVDLF